MAQANTRSITTDLARAAIKRSAMNYPLCTGSGGKGKRGIIIYKNSLYIPMFPYWPSAGVRGRLKGGGGLVVRRGNDRGSTGTHEVKVPSANGNYGVPNNQRWQEDTC